MQFYFTVHRQDLNVRRLPVGCRVMLVAASAWNEHRKRFRHYRLPVEHLAGWCLDSGGFTAAKRWGQYPWTPGQYAEWAGEMSQQMPLDFVACLDYACEPAVNRTVYTTNLQRIESTLANEQACYAAAPDLPWLPVLQGDSLQERAYDLRRRRALGLIPQAVAGIGSICGRAKAAARGVIRFYAEQLLGVRYHAFGLDCRVLDGADDVALVLASWDSYGWTWASGTRGQRTARQSKSPDESYTAYVRRLAETYLHRTVNARVGRARQQALPWG